MASKVKFVPRPHLEGILARDVNVGKVTRARAEAGARAAQNFAPVQSGDYKAGIEAISGVNEKGKLVGRIVAKDFKSGWIEFGTSKMRAHACLRRGVESIGLRLVRRGR